MAVERTAYRKWSEAKRIDSLIQELSKPIDGYRVLDVDECDGPLLVKALGALNRKAANKTEWDFECCGCRLQRVLGSHLGRRGNARKRYGYKLTHLATGETHELVPQVDRNVSPRDAKSYVETWSRICELEAKDGKGDVR